MRNDIPNIRILLVGGGSGGHFYPLISIAESLNAHPAHPTLFFAGPDRYDETALTHENISYIHIKAGKQRRYTSILNTIDMVKTAWGVFVALIRLYILYPDVVMSKGGYTSVPVVLAAAFLRIPIVIHESDAVVGRANKLASRFARHIIVAYEEAKNALPHHVPVQKLGIPIRSAFFQKPTVHAIADFGIDPSRPVILVIGGSQGAEKINSFILDALDELLVDFSVIHQTGVPHHELCVVSAENLIPNIELRKHYHAVPFLNAQSLNDAYWLSRIVISRAGSTSIYEIALHGKPSILIPISEEVSHDQRTNAYAYARSGGAIVLEEKNLSDGLLRAEIDRIMQDDATYEQMSRSASQFAQTDTAQKMAEILIETAKTH